MGKLGCALIAVIVASGVSACSEDADGDTPTPAASESTASATPSDPTSATSPTAEAPKLPENARGDSAESAAHFVEYYVKLMNYSASTGDTKALKAASQGCDACNSYIRLYEKTYRNGGFSGNPGWNPTNPVFQRVGDHVTVLVDVKTRAFRYKAKENAPTSRAKATSYELRFEVVSVGDSWLVSKLDDRAKRP